MKVTVDTFAGYVQREAPNNQRMAVRLDFYPNVTTLRSVFAIANPSVVCRLSVVCSVHAPYSGS